MIRTDGRPTIANAPARDFPGRIVYTETRQALERVAELERALAVTREQVRQRDHHIAGLQRELERVR